MGQLAAKHGDQVLAMDEHFVLVPNSPPQLLAHPFKGVLNSGLSADVRITGKPAATVGSTAANTPAHIPTPPGTGFQSPPTNQGTVTTGSATVRINGQPAARHGDKAKTCNDPVDKEVGKVVAPQGSVWIG